MHNDFYEERGEMVVLRGNVSQQQMTYFKYHYSLALYSALMILHTTNLYFSICIAVQELTIRITRDEHKNGIGHDLDEYND